MWKEILTKIILLLSLFLTGCQREKENMMDTLRINFQEGDLPSLHPHEIMIYLRGLSIAKTLYEGLTRIDLDGKPQLAGAESVDISPNRLRYTFTLRENRWSDGSLVTAEQYEHAWKEALSPVSMCSRANLLYAVKNGENAKKGLCPLSDVGVTALDEKTLAVDLEYPFPYILELLAQPLCAPLRKASSKDISVFNGPFMVELWERGKMLHLKPNPYFWNKKNVALKRIDVSMMQDATTVFHSFEKGLIDWIGVPLSNLGTEQIGHLKKTGILRSHPVDRAFWIFLNTQHSALSSPSIRQALSLAIDRGSITKHILIGGQPLSKPLPASLLTKSSSSRIKENLTEAKELFEKGLKELGLTRETFPSFAISFAQQPNRKQLAEYLKDTWEKAFDIHVSLDSQEWNTLRTNVDRGLFEATGMFEAAFYKDPLEILERFATKNPGNFSQWENEAYQEKISLAKLETKPQKRAELLSEAEQILIQEMPFIPVSSDLLLFSHPQNLRGYVFDYVGAIDFSYASRAK